MAAVAETQERMDHLASFARRALEQLQQGLPPPAVSDMEAYRRLTITALRKLMKFPRAVIPMVGLQGREKGETALAEIARQAISALSLGLIDPSDLVWLQIALPKVRELPADPEPRRRRPKPHPLQLGEARVVRALPERTGPSTRDLFGDLE